MTNPRNDNATGHGGEDRKAEAAKPKRIKKIDCVEAALRMPAGLNRFEAERIGDHCLNSTAADLRKRYGNKLKQQWETVPTRYCETGVRVYRYWLVGGS